LPKEKEKKSVDAQRELELQSQVSCPKSPSNKKEPPEDTQLQNSAAGEEYVSKEYPILAKAGKARNSTH
jgi:hypothetical protein